MVPPRVVDMKGGEANTPLKIGSGSHGGAAAFVPLHGLLFLLCELHMKTPEEILEKVPTNVETGVMREICVLRSSSLVFCWFTMSQARPQKPQGG